MWEMGFIGIFWCVLGVKHLIEIARLSWKNTLLFLYWSIWLLVACMFCDNDNVVLLVCFPLKAFFSFSSSISLVLISFFASCQMLQFYFKSGLSGLSMTLFLSMVFSSTGSSKLWGYFKEEPVLFGRQGQAQECSCRFGALLVALTL